MDEERQKMILDDHNRRRGILARGELPGVFAKRKGVRVGQMVSKSSFCLSLFKFKAVVLL